MIKVVAKAKLKPGVKVEDYLRIAKEVISETRKEKGCITYTLHEDINDPTILTMLEEWDNEEALHQHNKSEHVLKIVPELRKLRESTEINLYRELK
ncbi:putative quinol monooxygenase [Sporosarcina sp. FSL K6-3457]|uniref:putative quinol monooxygenase n=1 Tax=Sporosarcina sp. FSL K6-3457 TaxID=2978204 RepID=UPI0030F812C8